MKLHIQSVWFYLENRKRLSDDPLQMPVTLDSLQIKNDSDLCGYSSYDSEEGNPDYIAVNNLR